MAHMENIHFPILTREQMTELDDDFDVFPTLKADLSTSLITRWKQVVGDGSFDEEDADFMTDTHVGDNGGTTLGISHLGLDEPAE